MAAYLDYNATTPLDPRVRAIMDEWLGDGFGNASSRDHRWGWDAAAAVEDARIAVASAAHVPPRGVVFMSGATEALNTVLRGYIGFCGWSCKRIVVCATEHEAVLAPSRHLAVQTGIGFEIVRVDGGGRIDIDNVIAAMGGVPRTLVAVMFANNEIGTIQPIREVAERVHAANGRLLCDTSQAFGKMKMDVDADQIDFATVSAHKLCGPKGSGALLLRHPELDGWLEPLVLGGGQESGMRGGTLNVPAIVGLGEACRLAEVHVGEDALHIERLRDRLEQTVLSEVSDTWVNSDPRHRVCNTTNIGFKEIDAGTLIRDMHDVAVSTRSACSSGNSGPSHVLKAIGLSDEDAYSCIRFSLGRFTTQDEIDYTIKKVVTSVHKLRSLKSLRS